MHNPTQASSWYPHGSTDSQASRQSQASHHGTSHHRNTDATSVHTIPSIDSPPAPITNISIPSSATLKAPQSPAAAASNPSSSNPSSWSLSLDDTTSDVTIYASIVLQATSAPVSNLSNAATASYDFQNELKDMILLQFKSQKLNHKHHKLSHEARGYRWD